MKKSKHYLKECVSESFIDTKELSPSLHISIERIVQSEKYTIHNVNAKMFNSDGGSYLGKLYEIEIEGETAEGQKKTDIFVKEIMDLPNVKILSIKEIYLVENFAYKELSKIFETLQVTVNVPVEDQFKMAKMYNETSADAIILENLHKRGFMEYDRIDVIPLKYAELAVQELAKFHGLSFVMENKMQNFYNDKIKTIKHPFKYVEEWNTLVRKVCEYLIKSYDVEMRLKIDRFLETFTEKFIKLNSVQKSFICCLIHGDYRVNNVLVRELNDEAEEVMVIDYQLMDYGCPIRDLLFFIFSSTNREFRRQHLDTLKEMYYGTLSRFLKYFNMNVEAVYPRKEFEKAYTECLDYGLIKVLYASAFLFAPKSGADLNNMSDITFSPDKKVEMKICELIEDFIEWGYL